MLSRFDEFLIHQTPEPLLHPVSMDRNIYDRYWLGGLQQDGGFYFAASLGLYPNRQVMDCGFSLVIDGEQHAFFGSRRAPLDRAQTSVGPFTIDVLEPMKSLRLRLAPNDSGLTCDLRYTARSACVQEDRQTLRRGSFTWMDVTRFTQFGDWEGEVCLGSRRIAVQASQVRGIRDRSWGRRNVGEPDQGAPAAAPEVYFLWTPLFWEDHASLAVFFEDSKGRAYHSEGKTVPFYASSALVPGIEDPALQHLAGVSRHLEYVPGTRRAKSATIKMLGADGSLREVMLEPLLQFQMKGTGYGHPQWRHGMWKGELATGHDSWRIAELDPLAPENLHIQQVVRCSSEGKTGIGIMEQLCIGPHHPSGFTRLNDGAVPTPRP